MCVAFLSIHYYITIILLNITTFPFSLFASPQKRWQRSRNGGEGCGGDGGREGDQGRRGGGGRKEAEKGLTEKKEAETAWGTEATEEAEVVEERELSKRKG